LIDKGENSIKTVGSDEKGKETYAQKVTKAFDPKEDEDAQSQE